MDASDLIVKSYKASGRMSRYRVGDHCRMLGAKLLAGDNELNDSTAQYRVTVRVLSERLVEAQRPIRVLDAIKWSPEVEARFFADDCKALPVIDQEFYGSTALGFDVAAKISEFRDLERDIQSQLGKFNAVSRIMLRMSDEYKRVCEMLAARGTAEFGAISAELYGAASDVFHAGDPTLAELGELMGETLKNLEQSELMVDEPRNISGDEAVQILQQRLDNYFHAHGERVSVKLSDGIIADAAAGADYIKLRSEAKFNERDLRMLEVHEGWVHIGTTLNGLAQPYCTFLGKGPPTSTVTQEGLAVLMEIITMVSFPARLRRTSNRIRAIAMAENGADFLDVFRFFREQGYNDRESYNFSFRVFRGSTPNGKPFTKDLSYSKGFIQIYNFVRLAVRRGKVDRIRLLFCGKTTLEDVGVLAQLIEEGLVIEPKYLPPQLSDPAGLVAWMCYSNFLNRLNLQKAEADYASIL